MKIVVTGAGGFIGDAVAKKLSASGSRVIACVGIKGSQSVLQSCQYHGVLDSAEFGHMIQYEQPDFLVHCAGSASVGASIANPERDHANNVLLTRSIYSSVAQFSPRTRIVFTSSAAVYGQPDSLPVNEWTACNPISPYGKHKLECEEIGEWFRQHHNLDIINLRIFSAYGPGLRKQVLWDIFQKSIDSETVLLGGDGSETRDFVYVDDIAKLIDHIVQVPSWKQSVLDVASGESVTIRRLAERFLSVLEYRGQLCFSGEISAGSPRFWSASSETLSRFNLGPSVLLDEGLREYVRWIRDIEGVTNSNRFLARAG